MYNLCRIRPKGWESRYGNAMHIKADFLRPATIWKSDTFGGDCREVFQKKSKLSICNGYY